MVRRLSCRLKGYSPQDAEAEVVLDGLAPGRRLARALAGFGFCIGGALVSLFIPIAHFVLVPGFLIAAFIVSVARYGVATLVIAAHGTCPDCGSAQELDLLGPWKGFREVTCRNCHRPMKLSPAEASPRP